MIGATLVLLFTLLYVPPFANFFQIAPLNVKEIGSTILISSISVLWFEFYKFMKRKRS